MTYHLLHSWIRAHWIRLFIVSVVLVLTAYIAKNQVYTIIVLSDLAPEGQQLSLLDYFIGMLSAPQLFMFFIFPVLFAILVSDLVISEVSGKQIRYRVLRYGSRRSYIIEKYESMIGLSILFVIMVVIVTVFTWLAMGVRLESELHHYIFVEAAFHDRSILLIVLQVLIRFIIGIIMVGFITLYIALLSNSAVMAVGFIILTGFLHNAFYVMSAIGIITLPFTQYIYGLQSLYAPFGIPVSFFTSLFSYSYMISLIVLLAYLHANRFNKLEL